MKVDPNAIPTFKAMVRAGEVGVWLKTNRPEWEGVDLRAFSNNGNLRVGVSTDSQEEAEILAAACHKDGYVVAIVPRRYPRDGRDQQDWFVAFSRGDFPGLGPWPE